MFDSHLAKRPTILQNDIRDDHIILVEGHEDCELYAYSTVLYNCACKVTRERDCDGTITMNRCSDCDEHWLNPRIIIPTANYR